MKSDLIDLMMIIHRETEKAILASADGDCAKAVWLPKSQVEFERRAGPGPSVWIVTMPERMAIEKGLV